MQLFESTQVRMVWNEEEEKYYFAIVDVVQVLTESTNAPAYWRKLKQRLKAEGNETVTNCHTFKKQPNRTKATNTTQTTQ